MKKQKHGQKQNNKTWTLRVLIVAVLLLSCLTSGILAKYAKREETDVSVGAAEFYFRSDLLKEENTTYVLNASTQTVTLYLYNHADALRVSQMDIVCTVTASGGLTVQKDTDTLQKDDVSQIAVRISGFQPGETYTVTATGEGGYKQTLTAKFTVRTVDEGFYQYTDCSKQGKVELIVWTGNKSGQVTFTIPAGLIPDRRDPFFEGFTGDTVTFTIDAHSLKKFKFILAADYTGTPKFTVKLNGSIVAEETLPTT